MVRTKDLVLIMVVLVMLFMAISATVASRMIAERTLEDPLAGTAAAELPEYGALESATGEIDRSANIEHLRSLLAQGDVIESTPSVEMSPVPESATPSSSAVTCSAPSTGIEVARAWPLANNQVKVSGAMRTVVQIGQVMMPVSSATGTLAEFTVPMETVLLELPLYPGKNSTPTCPVSEIIGVTAGGSLLFNNDIVLHRQSGPETLIGYALDGFPIYGAYTGAVDECGGYDAPQGYRYVVAPQETAFLRCFVGSPRTFKF